MWIQFVQCRIPRIYILYLERIKTSRKKRENNKTDDDNMYGNTSLPLTQEEYVPTFITL